MMAEMLYSTVQAVCIRFSQAFVSGSPMLYQLCFGLNPFPSTLRTDKLFHVERHLSFEYIVHGPGDLVGQYG